MLVTLQMPSSFVVLIRRVYIFCVPTFFYNYINNHALLDLQVSVFGSQLVLILCTKW